MVENDLTETAKALINVNQRLQKIENSGSTGGGNTGGGNTGGGNTPPVDPTVPDSGVNVDPGKALTDQKEVWTGSTKVNQEDKLTLDSSINKNLDNVGDGLQFVFKIVKTPLDAGTQGDTVGLTPVASSSTAPQSGKYVCSVPVPISIKKGSFAAGKTLTVALEGIGEGLPNITKSAPPEIQLTLNSDGTISTKPIEGYAFDHLTAGSTGAYYDVVLTSVTTYTIGTPVVSLAAGTALWSGTGNFWNTMGNPVSTVITLDNKLKADYSNVGKGIAFSIGGNFANDSESVSAADIPFSTPLEIAKADLVSGKTVKFTTNAMGKSVLVRSSGGSENRNVTGNCTIGLTIGVQSITLGIDSPLVARDSFAPTITKFVTY